MKTKYYFAIEFTDRKKIYEVALTDKYAMSINNCADGITMKQLMTKLKHADRSWHLDHIGENK